MHEGTRYALVAGGAGFVGSHLVDSLLNDGWFVDVVDNFTTGKMDNVRQRLRPDLDPSVASLRVQHLDIVGMRKDPSRSPKSRYDVVYNLACPASPKAYQSDPRATVMTSVVGTANLIDLAEAHGAVLVHASTSEVYGDPLEHPQKESYWGNVNPYGKRACYDESKRCAETLCFDARAKNIDCRVARIFNTYGPRMDPYDGRVVSTFVRQAILGEPLTVYGSGEQTRSFCYVSDTVRALRVLGEAENWDRGPVNVGNDAEFKVIELTEQLSTWFSRLLVVHEPLPMDDPALRKPDLALAKVELGYFPEISLVRGLELTVEWMRARMAK